MPNQPYSKCPNWFPAPLKTVTVTSQISKSTRKGFSMTPNRLNAKLSKLLFACCISTAANIGYADSLAVIDWTPATWETQVTSVVTLGWEFTAHENITVTDLGIWDQGMDGLVESHEVAIWDDSENILVQSVVPLASRRTQCVQSLVGSTRLRVLLFPRI